MSETLRKAVVELDMLGTPIDDSGRRAVEALLAKLVAMQDMDSPTARDWVVGIFSRLANHEVLTPLTGQSHEWREIPEHQRAGEYNYQNTRETSVMAKAQWRPRYADEMMQMSGPAFNKDKDPVLESMPDVFQIEKAIDTQALRIQRGTDEMTGWATWVPITFPYMPQRFHINYPQEDAREDHELETEARIRAMQNGQVVFGGRTS